MDGKHASDTPASGELKGRQVVAITNHERVGKALELLKDGLRPFVERELKARASTTPRYRCL